MLPGTPSTPELHFCSGKSLVSLGASSAPELEFYGGKPFDVLVHLIIARRWPQACPGQVPNKNFLSSGFHGRPPLENYSLSTLSVIPKPE